MSSLYLASLNLATSNDTEYTLLTGTSNSQYPLTNIKHPFTTKIARVTGSTVEFQIDTKTSSTKNLFCIVGSSVDGLGFETCKIYGSATTDFTGATEVTVPLSSKYKFGYKIFDSDESYRYYKVKVTSSGTYCDISNIYLGESEVLTTNTISNKGFEVGVVDHAKVTKNAYSQRFIEKYNKLKTLSGTIDLINSSEHSTIKSTFDYCGISTPIWLLLDTDNASLPEAEYIYSGYYFFDKSPSFKRVSHMLWSSKLTLTQGA